MMSADSGIAPASGALGAHDAPEWVLTMGRNRCSRSPGITAHDRPEWVLTMRRNTHSTYIMVIKRYPDESTGSTSAVFGLVTKRRLVFATEKSSDTGIEYRFEGEFLRTDFDAVANKDKAVLRGVLTRSKDGRTLVERTVTFKFVYMGC